jgi:transcriptional regulator with XRE-family HTH domain
MIHDKIKQLRINKKLSQQDMADALHMAQNTYSRIEKGDTKLLDEERIKSIAKVLGVATYELFEGNDVILNFNDKVENGYASFIQNLNADNKDIMQSLTSQLQVKDSQIEQLLKQNQKLISLLKV